MISRNSLLRIYMLFIGMREGNSTRKGKGGEREKVGTVSRVGIYAKGSRVFSGRRKLGKGKRAGEKKPVKRARHRGREGKGRARGCSSGGGEVDRECERERASLLRAVGPSTCAPQGRADAVPSLSSLHGLTGSPWNRSLSVSLSFPLISFASFLFVLFLPLSLPSFRKPDASVFFIVFPLSFFNLFIVEGKKIKGQFKFFLYSYSQWYACSCLF